MVTAVAKTVVPAFWPQVGQAPMPWVRRTFSATRICYSREAWCGIPEPPLDFQVAGENWSPP